MFIKYLIHAHILLCGAGGYQTPQMLWGSCRMWTAVAAVVGEAEVFLLIPLISAHSKCKSLLCIEGLLVVTWPFFSHWPGPSFVFPKLQSQEWGLTQCIFSGKMCQDTDLIHTGGEKGGRGR